MQMESGPVLEEKLLLEVNYQYESLQHSDQFDKHSRCPSFFLLLGYESGDRGDTLTDSIQLDLIESYSGDGNRINFDFDVESAITRCNLLCTTNPKLNLNGVMILNNKYYDYESILRKALLAFNSIRWLLIYEPTKSQKQLLLSCLKVCLEYDNGQLNVRTLNAECSIKTPEVSYEVGELVNKLEFHTELTSNGTLFSKLIPQLETQKQLINDIKVEIGRMLNYLQRNGNDPALLRKIALVVTQLRKPPTNDINEMIMNAESELNVIKIACAQWELKKKNPNLFKADD